MQRRATWIRTCHGGEPLEASVREALGAHGVRIEAGIEVPYGILCVAKVDEQVVSLLRDARGNQQCRLLVVAATNEHAETKTIWRLLRAGAADVLVWGTDGAAPQLAAKLDRWFEVDELAWQGVSEGSLIGESPAWHNLIRRVVEAARFSNIPILLMGESGTGKELLAKLISVVCANSSGPNKLRKELITIDCASLVPELSGSEFFGHERGAFTGAHLQREGAFALADGATLLLDEIGEVPLALQAQLLRAIQEKTYKRVGGNVWQKTNCRVVCATNRDLEDAIRRGQFRQDLYYRIAGLVLRPPSLKERPEDIVPLARYFLGQCCGGPVPEFDKSVVDYLINRTYDGNIRELRQLIQRIAHRHAGPGPITVGDIPEDDRPSGELLQMWPDEGFDQSISRALASGATLKEITQAAADTAIRIAVRGEGDNLQRAASKLGVTDRTLQMRRANQRQRA